MKIPASKLLKDIFGFDKFKPLQEEIIHNVLAWQDTLVIMPTGGGKSLCYQIPAMMFDGVTVVISPLISLMKDQVEQLKELGVPALFLNSSLTPQEYQENIGRIRRKEVKLIYVAPETLLTPRLLSLLDSVQVDSLAIDEAHCISEWGHDFRPEYRQLVAVRQRYPKAVCIALTATATPRVRADIQHTLGFKKSNEFIASFNRENLFLEIRPKNDPTSQTIQFIRRFPDQSGIIYCFSRRQVDELADVLTRKGFSARPYHAGLTDDERKRNQEAFIRDNVQIIVATIAFGMGINKPNVRFIVHFDLPKNIESYYQEIGRAGRDGLPAHCLLLFSYGDVQKIKYFINQKDEPERRAAVNHLNSLLRYAESDVCRRIPLLSYFGETYSGDNCGMCDTCHAGHKNQVDLTIPAQMFLSCVKRSGEIFGANHVIDVLLGEENAKVQKFGHQNLSTFGIGKDYSKKQWLRLSLQLIQRGYLAKEEKFGSLKLTPQAYELLRNREQYFGVMDEIAVEEAPRKASASGRGGELEYNLGLFEALRKKRKEIADKAGVPPYVIFSDRTLVEMAAYYPQSSSSLLEIHGVGSVKFANYGEIFLELIRNYCQQYQIEERRKIRPGKAVAVQGQPSQKSEQKLRHIVIGDLFNEGHTIPEIMEMYDIQQDTVINHLSKYLLEGHSLRSYSFLPSPSITEDMQKLVMDTFERLGSEYLRPAYDALNGTVTYDELKLLRLHFLCRGRSGKGKK